MQIIDMEVSLRCKPEILRISWTFIGLHLIHPHNGYRNPLRETSKSDEEIRENTFKNAQIHVYIYK